jgi:anti-repressor protein
MELIKITEKEGIQLISARELHEFLEVGRDFSTWINERIAKYNFVENEDFTTELGKNNIGRPTKEYILKIDMAKELSMVENNEKGRMARKYFIECEKKLRNKFTLPTTYIEALKQLVISEEKRIEAERKNAILMHINKNYTATEIAKECNLKSAIELNKILKDNKIQYKSNDTWVTYSEYSGKGYFDIKQEVLDNGRVIYHRRITQYGRDFILNNIENWLNKEAD